MKARGRLRALLRSEHGFTLIETLASMTILMTVMGGIAALMVSGTNAEVDMNRRFQAQTEARLGLDKLRKDVHCSYNVTPNATTPTREVMLSMSSSCPTSGGGTSITWCMVQNLTGPQPRWGLWRYVGATCGGTGRKLADNLTNASGAAFSNTTWPAGYVAPVPLSKELKTLPVTLDVNLTPTKAERVYSLQDDLVLRNSVRA